MPGNKTEIGRRRCYAILFGCEGELKRERCRCRPLFVFGTKKNLIPAIVLQDRRTQFAVKDKHNNAIFYFFIILYEYCQ